MRSVNVTKCIAVYDSNLFSNSWERKKEPFFLFSLDGKFKLSSHVKERSPQPSNRYWRAWHTRQYTTMEKSGIIILVTPSLKCFLIGFVKMIENDGVKAYIKQNII